MSEDKAHHPARKVGREEHANKQRARWQEASDPSGGKDPMDKDLFMKLKENYPNPDKTSTGSSPYVHPRDHQWPDPQVEHDPKYNYAVDKKDPPNPPDPNKAPPESNSKTPPTSDYEVMEEYSSRKYK
jgi:hypothetical protein